MEARRLQDRPLGGVGRSLVHLVAPLAELVDLELVTDARATPLEGPGRVVALRAPRPATNLVWLHGAVGRWARRELRAEGSLFHGTFNAIPLGLPCPSVVTIYDLSFELHPEDFGKAKRRAFQLHARLAARHATRIITLSQFVADQIVEHYGVAADRVVVTPCSYDSAVFSADRAADAARVAAAIGVGHPYVVAVGGAPRRGAEVAVAAWRVVRARGHDIDLVVVGGLPPEVGLEPGLHQPRRLDDEDWASLLAGARALVYPTRYEGWGMPALEAAASGTPVVCAPVASLPEVVGDAAEWVARPTTADIADGLDRVLSDDGRAAQLRADGLTRAAAMPSWRAAAEATARVYEEAMGA
jgi:alpha-1,3-rhamnosyl/mannosyltransferase